MNRAVNAMVHGMLLFALLPLRAGEMAATSVNDNAALVRSAFDNWRAGTGSVFDLLADDVQWTVAGSSPVSGTYGSKQDFMERAVAPITARLATPIVPELEHLVVQGNAVVVVWRGVASAHDGSAYINHYAWHMLLEEGRIVRVVAFLDTWALDALMGAGLRSLPEPATTRCDPCPGS